MSDGMSGWLEKKGHVFPSWKRRYFVFDPVRRILTYSSMPPRGTAAESPLGVCDVRGAFDVADRPGKRPNRLDVDVSSSAKGGQYILSVSAASAAEKAAWFDALATEDQRQRRRQQQNNLRISGQGRALLDHGLAQRPHEPGPMPQPWAAAGGKEHMQAPVE